MRKTTCALALAAALVLGGTARASGPIGVYALVKKVALEPNGKAPTRIRIWGTFALAKARGEAGYREPVQGYLYYALNPDDLERSRKEWADLKKVAGTGQCVAFGEQGQALGHVHKANEKAKDPDIYPIARGMIKVPDTNPQAKRLKEGSAP